MYFFRFIGVSSLRVTVIIIVTGCIDIDEVLGGVSNLSLDTWVTHEWALQEHFHVTKVLNNFHNIQLGVQSLLRLINKSQKLFLIGPAAIATHEEASELVLEVIHNLIEQGYLYDPMFRYLVLELTSYSIRQVLQELLFLGSLVSFVEKLFVFGTS